MSFRDAPIGAGPESILPIVVMDSGLASRPGMTSLVNRRLADRRAETAFEEIEIAAFIGLFDVPGEHPAIAALKTDFRLLPGGAAFCQFGLRHIEIDGALGDIERDHV